MEFRQTTNELISGSISKIIAAAGVYLVAIGVAFTVISGRNGLPWVVAVASGALDFVIGTIVILCAALCQPRKVAVISVTGAAILFVSISISVLFGDRFTSWNLMRLFGIVLLAVPSFVLRKIS